MNLTEKDTFKIICAFLIVTGVYRVFMSIYVIYYGYEYGMEHYENFSQHFSIWITFKHYHYRVFLGLITLIAGWLLALKKRLGYYLSLFSTLLIFISYILSGIKSYDNNPFMVNTLQTNELFLLLLLICLPLLYLFTFLYLNKRNFRLKFGVTNKFFLVLIIMVILSSLDNYFLSSSAIALMK